MTWNRNANKRTEKNTIIILNYFICVFDVVGIPFVCISNACIIFIFLMAVRHLGSSLAPDVDGVYVTLLCQSSWWLWQLYEVYFAPRKPAVKGKGAKQKRYVRYVTWPHLELSKSVILSVSEWPSSISAPPLGMLVRAINWKLGGFRKH